MFICYFVRLCVATFLYIYIEESAVYICFKYFTFNQFYNYDIIISCINIIMIFRIYIHIHFRGIVVLVRFELLINWIYHPSKYNVITELRPFHKWIKSDLILASSVKQILKPNRPRELLKIYISNIPERINIENIKTVQ